jgi:GT2 family glycosyltransferase
MDEFFDKNTKICVVMLTYNQMDRTLDVLSNLKTIQSPPFGILVWDNGSSDGTVDAVRLRFPDVFAHHHHENLGVAPGRNAAALLAIKTFSPTHLLFLDNDMFVEPEFVGALFQPFLEGEKVGQTQAKLRFMDDKQRLNDGGGCEITYWLGRTRPVGFGEIDEGQYDKQKECVACGGAMMVRSELFQELGGFDEAFGVLGPDDLDFSLRLNKAGYKALYIPEAVAYHKVSHTYGRDYHEKYARLKAYNWFIFMRRHASLPQRFAFYLVGAPYLLIRILIREAKKGNLTAMRGLVRGMFDFFREIRFGNGDDKANSFRRIN